MERAVITSRNGRALIDLPVEGMTANIESPAGTGQPVAIVADDEMQERVRRNMLAALEQCNWKLFGEDGAASLLGLKPTTLASRIKRMGLKPGG
jgi:transcriptional regulator with GAF, ATPase, and Fis domain